MSSTSCADSTGPTSRSSTPLSSAIPVRAPGRAPPFGLFGGVGLATFGPDPVARLGAAHRRTTAPDAVWLSRLVTTLARDRGLLDGLLVWPHPQLAEVGGALVLVSTDAP